MHTLIPLALLIPAGALLAVVALPASQANAHTSYVRRWVVAWSAVQALIAGCLAVAFALGLLDPVRWNWALPVTGLDQAVGVYYDGITSLMFAMVSFVGWIVCRYSERYLDGESTQGQFFRWTGVCLGAVSWMVISSSMLMFVAAWIATSLSLHQLLLHYGHRPAAQRAAWTKFTVSRFGDVALVACMALLLAEFKTLSFAELFAALSSPTLSVTPNLQWASLLLLLGAVTKSAQLPFHTWLPQTMETPTPVSAFMHAGIVNAGGYLVIRMSPLVTLTPWLLTALAVIGGLTACYGALVMLTQSSVKKSLAYSTIAQMGFMMLQCGIGAFSAAMLHILAHSLYKAHAFLSSGSVLNNRAAQAGLKPRAQAVSWSKLGAVALANLACFALAMAAFGISPLNKPGGVLLGFILCLALTDWLYQVMRTGNSLMLFRGLATCAGMCLAYAACYFAVDSIVSIGQPPAFSGASVGLIATLIVAGFGGLVAVQVLRSSMVQLPWLQAMRVHAANGFYLDAILRRSLGHLAAHS